MTPKQDITGTAPLTKGCDHAQPARQWPAGRALLVLVVAFVAAAWIFGLGDWLSLQTIADNYGTLKAQVTGRLALALAIYALIYALAVALSFPGAVALTLVGGALFGGLAASIATVFAATAGAVVVFLLARSAFGTALANRASPRLSRLGQGFRRNAFSYLLFLRLVPAFPFWLVNIAPALLNMRLLPYAVATLIGIVPGSMAFAFIGAGLEQTFLDHQGARAACEAAGKTTSDCALALKAGELVSPELVIGLTALGVVSLLPLLWRRRKDLQSVESSPSRNAANDLSRGQG